MTEISIPNRQIHATLDASLLPAERPYPVPDTITARVGMAQVS